MFPADHSLARVSLRATCTGEPQLEAFNTDGYGYKICIVDSMHDQAPHMSMYFAVADRQVESVMELTSILGEHQLPALTAGLVQSCGNICDAAAVTNCLEALATSLGMQSA